MPRRFSDTRRVFAGLRLAVGLALLSHSTARAQINVNTAGAGGPALASDDVPLGRVVPVKQEVDGDASRARLRLGPVRILPGFAVTNAGYDSNVFATSQNPVSDWTATFSAGARFLVPMGTKLYLVADAFPQYTWYDKLSERDVFGGLYDASLLGFFNHLSVQFTGSYSESYALYSTEVDSRVFETAANAIGKFELDLSSRWSLIGQGAFQHVKYEQKQGPPGQELQVQLNNRDDTGGRGGLRYHLSPSVSLAALVEGTWADFDVTPNLRNNRSTAYLGSVHYDRPSFYVNLIGGYRDGVGTDSELFPHYATGVGSFFASWLPLGWLEVQGYGHRRIAYSVTLVNPYYFENRLGGRLNFQIGPRLLIYGYGEAGPNQYPRSQPVDGVLVKRRDNSELYGGGFSVIVYHQVVLTGIATRSIYDSNIPGDSRSYTRYGAFLSFSGVLQR